jgi:type IV pilus assembly protein PilM
MRPWYIFRMDLTASDFVQKIRKPGTSGSSFIGIDIGSSSTKIVQLAFQDGVARLETYGEIRTASYADPVPGRSAAGGPGPEPDPLGSALLDLLHEVKAASRRCAVAIPLSGTLINTVDLPKRDPEQMRIIVPQEAKQYIPVPIESVMLDWYALPEEETSAFDTLKPKTPVEVQFQKVMIVAVTNETAQKLKGALKDSALACEFYEIEMFSTVRSCARTTGVPSLILDLGASSTKAYIVDEHWITLSAGSSPAGGYALTQAVMASLACDLQAAERAKCEQGATQKSALAATIDSALAPVWTYAQEMLDEYKENNERRGGKKIERILLSGGGSYMPGITDLIASKLSLPVEIIRAFDRTHGPMILESTLREDGPRFAVAVGLALRGIGR